jgi:hypothetical protein
MIQPITVPFKRTQEVLSSTFSTIEESKLPRYNQVRWSTLPPTAERHLGFVIVRRDHDHYAESHDDDSTCDVQVVNFTA